MKERDIEKKDEVKEKDGGGGRERERERERERQTGRQTDRQTDRQTEYKKGLTNKLGH